MVVLVLGGVLYAKWQPIRDYVLTPAPSHSRPQPPPAQDTKNEPPSTSATSAPATTLAGSDAASQPAITAEGKPEQNQAAQPSQELPHADPQSSTAGKPDDSPKPTPARASSERAAGPASKPAAAQMAPAPQGNAGGELVSSGERYLYARGVARNCGQAVTYFNAAAAMQNPQAFSHLGALYATGECVPMDRAVAYAWFPAGLCQGARQPLLRAEPDHAVAGNNAGRAATGDRQAVARSQELGIAGAATDAPFVLRGKQGEKICLCPRRVDVGHRGGSALRLTLRRVAGHL